MTCKKNQHNYQVAEVNKRHSEKGDMTIYVVIYCSKCGQSKIVEAR
jgi:hypothetical protein